MTRILLILLAAAVVVGMNLASFFIGAEWASQRKEPATATNISVLPVEKAKEECPELPGCVYNDYYSYKLIRFKHKDGTTCYGIRPYNQGKFESMWCEQ